MGWLSTYGYRQTVPLKRVDGAVEDYQMKLTVHKGTGDSLEDVVYLKDHALSWTGTVPNDLRFTNLAGTELKYWIESSDANTATVWIKFDSIETTDTDFYVYYGKADDTTTSNGADTFPEFFDHFPGDAIDTNKWDVGGTGSNVVSDSKVKVLSSATNGKRYIASKTAFGQGYALRGYAKLYNTDAAWRYAWFGFGKDGDTDYSSIMDYNDATTAYRYCRTLTDGNHTIDSTLSPDEIYHTFTIMRVSNDLCKFQQDDGSLISIATNVPDGDLKIALQARNAGDYTECDWLLIRKYVFPEPTWGTWGSEESSAQEHIKIVTESINFSDTMVKEQDLKRVLTESIQSVDSIVTSAKKFFRVFSDTTQMTDTVAKLTHKVVVESFTAIDNAMKSVRKVVTDALTMADSFIKQTRKTLLEPVTIVDTTVTLKKYFRVLTESTRVVDTVRKSFSKMLFDLVTMRDVIIKSIYRIFNETITFTDHAWRTFSILLFEAIQITDSMVTPFKKFFKVFKDTSQMADEIVKVTSRTLVDGMTIIDSSMRLVRKVFADALVVSDSLFKQIRKALPESVTLTDSISSLKSFFRVFVDPFVVIDSVMHTNKFFRVFTEPIETVDTLKKLLNKVLIDNVTAIDSTIRHFFKVLSETAVVVDAVEKVSSFGRTFIDNVSIADKFIRGRVFAELFTLAETQNKRYEYYNSGLDDSSLTFYGANSWAAQTFTTTDAHKITSIKIKLLRVGNPGTITISIQGTDGSGHPDGNEKCSGTYNGDLLTDDENGDEYVITLGDGYNLSANTKYGIVVKALNGSLGNCIAWRFDATVPLYGEGNYETTVDGGLNWTANTDRDFVFEEWSLSSGFRKQIGRAFLEPIIITVQLLGFAGRYVKAFVDSVLVTETVKLSKTFIRTLSEHIGIVESITTVKKLARMFSDTLHVVDSVTVIKALRKVFTDVVDAFESVEIKVTSFIPQFFEKIFTESMQATDNIKRVMVRSYSEIFNIVDTVIFTKSFTRVFADVIDVIENVGKRTRKVVLEAVNLTDKLIRGRVFSEVFNITDALVKRSYRVFSDIINVSDWWSIHHVLIVFTDHINTTDLVVTTKKFFRVLVDSLTTIDSAIRRTTKLLIDHVDVTDISLPVKGFFRIFTDAINVVDIYARTQTLGRTLTESLTVVDSAIRQTIKVVTENVSLTDKIVRGRVFTDTFTVISRVVKQTWKYTFSELVVVTETYTGVIWIAIAKLFAKVYELRFIVPTYSFKFLMYEAKEGMKTKFKFLKK